ncbi:MAG: hypothetical protein SFW67_02745 [Myxococcaceae bacterium]|nr:hypothetical protein [Myxococcaceae bacterium]
MRRRAPLVTITDAALPRRRFQGLLERIVALGAERLRESYQTTFWFSFDERPASLVDAAALVVRAHLPAHRRRGVVGVEWWLSRMRTSNVKVDFHRDRDNALFDATGRTVTPVTSSLLYLTHSVGGLLAVSTAPPNPRAPACAPDPSTFEVVEPRPNRFVFFDGRLTHGVLDARNEVPLKRLPTQPGYRLGIAINFWHRRPKDVPRFSESSHYRSLALGRRAE